MDIYQILKAEHVDLKKNLKEVEETTERAVKTREEGLKKICAALRSHAYAEEIALYARLEKDAALHDLLLEAKEEHKLTEMQLAQIEATPVTDEIWKAKVEVLRESLEHHFEEEEEKMFPKAKKIVDGDEAKEAGEVFLLEKKAFMERC